MSVITSTQYFEYPKHGTPCTFCNECLYPPFILYRDKNMIFICAECIDRHSDGLIADIVQVKAINNLRRLYPDMTLERLSLSHVSRKHQLEKR